MSNAKKKIMFLGGIPYIIPAIEAAHELGYYVITADYLPNNPAHQYADEYVNVSIIDKDAVLKVAREKQIDGILSFAVDPGVTVAAYVSEQMGLPAMGPYESACILQDKKLFRAFLTEHGFNVPAAKGYDSIEAALQDTDWLRWPMIVKPADGSGSKGVTRVDTLSEYKHALEVAMDFSRSNQIIVEEWIEKRGCSSDTDAFLLHGQWQFMSFDSQYFDAHAAGPYVPAAYSWPSTFTHDEEVYLTKELQRLVSLLHMDSSLFNIETRIGTNGKPYIMECTPRAGGNRLAEVLRCATGVDIIKAQVQFAVGDPVDISGWGEAVDEHRIARYPAYWVELMLHSDADGIFDGLYIDSSIRPNVAYEYLSVRPGDKVDNFSCATNALGSLFLRFDTRDDFNHFMGNQTSLVKVLVK